MSEGLWQRFTKRISAKLKSGDWGEVQAGKFLENKGYRILARQVRNGHREELDIVAGDGDILVFVEVKTRSSEKFGRPIEAVGTRKRQLLCRAAARYLIRLKNPRVNFRFDVVEVLGGPESGVQDIRHTQNCFSMDRRYTI